MAFRSWEGHALMAVLGVVTDHELVQVLAAELADRWRVGGRPQNEIRDELSCRRALWRAHSDTRSPRQERTYLVDFSRCIYLVTCIGMHIRFSKTG